MPQPLLPVPCWRPATDSVFGPSLWNAVSISVVATLLMLRFNSMATGSVTGDIEKSCLAASPLRVRSKLDCVAARSIMSPAAGEPVLLPALNRRHSAFQRERS